MTGNNLIVYSPFDSDHYSLRIGKVSPKLLEKPKDVIEQEIGRARQEGFRLLFVRVDVKNKAFAEKLISIGAHKFDTLVTCKMEFISQKTPAKNSFGNNQITVEAREKITTPDDIAAIGKISSETFDRSHLHNDPRLPLKKTRQLYADWAKNDATGRGQQTIIARENGKPVGFITLLVYKKHGVVDLVAVDKEHQGKGIGQLLVTKSIQWLAKNADVATVGTQEDNPALHLYQKAGFKPFLIEDTYHLWL